MTKLTQNFGLNQIFSPLVEISLDDDAGTNLSATPLCSSVQHKLPGHHQDFLLTDGSDDVSLEDGPDCGHVLRLAGRLDRSVLSGGGGVDTDPAH